jgi:hypothetical protein
MHPSELHRWDVSQEEANEIRRQANGETKKNQQLPLLAQPDT